MSHSQKCLKVRRKFFDKSCYSGLISLTVEDKEQHDWQIKYLVNICTIFILLNPICGENGNIWWIEGQKEHQTEAL